MVKVLLVEKLEGFFYAQWFSELNDEQSTQLIDEKYSE